MLRVAFAIAIFVSAIGVSALILRSQSGSVPLRQHLYQGIEFVRQGLGPEAEREWKQALRLDPDYWQAWRLLAEYYMNTGRWQDAIEAWEHVRRLSPNEPHSLCKLASATWAAGDEVKAWKLAEEEIRLEANCVEALSLAAKIANQLGDNKKTLDYLRRAVRQSPDDPGLLLLLGQALTALYEYREARKLLDHLIRVRPGMSDGFALLGVTYLDDMEASNRLENAEHNLRKAIELDPLNPNARLHMGRLALMRNEARDALLHLDQAIALMPTNARTFYELSRAYEQLGRRKESLRARTRFKELQQLGTESDMLEKRCVTDKNNYEYHYRLGLVKLQLGDFRLADFFLRRAREIKGNSAEVAAALKKVNEARRGKGIPSG